MTRTEKKPKSNCYAKLWDKQDPICFIKFCERGVNTFQQNVFLPCNLVCHFYEHLTFHFRLANINRLR